MRGRESGFTLLELAIVTTIMALIAINVSLVSRTGSDAARNGAFWMTLNDEADMTLDRISMAVMSSKSSNLYPRAVAPASNSEITYRTSLGMEAGQIVQSPLERIIWKKSNQRGRVVWSQSIGEPDERSVVWSNWVPILHERELANAIDDNGNGLTDEGGLAFDMDGELVHIHLTIRRESPDGRWVGVPRRIDVTCRN